MQVSVSGSTGFIGKALMRKIIAKGWTVSVINRMSFEMPDAEFLEKKIEGADVVINLAGTPIIKRWTEDNKKEMYNSRIPTARKIAKAIRNAGKKPGLMISASAIGIYDTEHEHTEESSGFDTGFLGNLCRDWESEALAIRDILRVVIFRTGLVLGKDGGVLKKMEFPFSTGMGAVIGNGKQSMSWIHLEDLLSAFLFVMDHDEIKGVVNAVAPSVTTNYHFTKTFGKVLTQPSFLRVPEFALRLVYGDGAQALTSGQKVIPEKLLKAGFDFKFPTIEKALMNLYK